MPEPTAYLDAAPALRVRRISKAFGDAKVLNDVTFDLHRGEVHALLGENGAGKSTLMNILTGIYAADSGRVEVGGKAVDIASPAIAMSLGIGMVHQHFKLVPTFTGRENIRLAAGAAESGSDWLAIDRRIEDVRTQTGLDVVLDVAVSALSVAERQRIEILKALTLGARILILDEPTAVLTDHEAERFLVLLRDLAKTDHAVIFITHKLREVMAAGDRVSTLRGGDMVMHGRMVSEVSRKDLSVAMIGDKDVDVPARQARSLGPAVLDVAGLSIDAAGVRVVRDVSLTVHAGEILGLAGVGGNGQQELAEALLGLRQSSGEIHLHGENIDAAGIAQRRDAGLRYIPADRTVDALAPNVSLADNIAAAAMRIGTLGKTFVRPSRILRFARKLIDLFRVAGAMNGGRRPIRLLSGGNAQKSVLARELDASARVIIAHSPARGLDIAACRYVHDRLIDAAERGAGILLISEDLEEILALSDHIHVISRGALSTTPNARPQRDEIGALMLGHA